MQEGSGCFALIWLYWFRRHMEHKPHKRNSANELLALQQHYTIEAIDNSNSSIAHRLSTITDRTRSTKGSPDVFTIYPDLEAKEIEAVILAETDRERSKEMLN